MFEHFAMLDSRAPASPQVDPGFCVVQGRLAMGKWIADPLGGGYIYTECPPGDDEEVSSSLRADSLEHGQHVDSSVLFGILS